MTHPAVVWLARCVALAALAVWQGGFVFYGAVVVPIGTDVLGSAAGQGIITRYVTVWLNGIGAVALVILAVELLVAHDCWRSPRWLMWLAMAGLLVGMYALHPWLVELIDEEAIGLRSHQRATFRRRHAAYLWLSTLQWATALAYLGTSVWRWRKMDRT